nr:hypothetical protein [Faecalibaculum rodentium]
MENKRVIKGHARPYRFFSRFLIAGYIVLFIPPLLLLLIILSSLLVGGEPVMGLASLIALLVYTVQLIRGYQNLSKETPGSFTASAVGIDFTGTDTVIGWNQVRKWSRKRKGILVILEAGPYRSLQTFSGQVLGHDDGFAFLLRPDINSQDKNTAYSELIQLLNQNTKDRKKGDHDHV